MKLGILIRHAIKLKTENRYIYSSFVNYFDIFNNFDYIEVMGFLAYKRNFKEISKSLFIFKNKVHSFSYTSCRINPLDFTQIVSTPANFALRNYKEIISSFGFIINPKLKQINESKKQEVFKLYQIINDILDNLPESIRQTLKTE